VRRSLRRTLIANRLVSGGTRAPLPFKVISTPVFDELARVIGVLAVLRPVDAADFQPGDARGAGDAGAPGRSGSPARVSILPRDS
jgi:hypothetical protein